MMVHRIGKKKKSLTNLVYGKGSIPRIYKEPPQFNKMPIFKKNIQWPIANEKGSHY